MDPQSPNPLRVMLQQQEQRILQEEQRIQQQEQRILQEEQRIQQQEQQIQQQQAQILALQQTVRQVEQFTAATAAAAAAAAAAPAVAPERANRRVEESGVLDLIGLNRLLSRPSKFRGEVGDYARNWLLEMDMLYANCDQSITEVKKVTFAVLYLRDAALSWWKTLEHEAAWAAPPVAASSGPAGAGYVLPIRDWTSFKAALLDHFSDRQGSESARAELHRLRQFNFRDLESYVAAFEIVARRIAVQPGQSIEEELISDFKAGLTEGHVRLFLSSSQPKTLLQAIRMAIQAEHDLRAAGMRSTPRGRSLAPHRGDLHRGDRFSNSRANGSYWGRPRFSSAARVGSNPDPDRSSSYASASSSSGSAPMELGTVSSTLDEVEDEAEESMPEDRSPEADEIPERHQDSGSESASDRVDAEANHLRLNVCGHCGVDLNAMQMRSRVRGGPPVCWNCGQVGHVQRACKTPRKPVDDSHRPGAGGAGGGAGGSRSKKPEDRRRGNFR
jgi:hypothetical protein